MVTMPLFLPPLGALSTLLALSSPITMMTLTHVGRFWLQIQSYELENPKYWKSGLQDDDQLRDYENEEVCYQVYVGK